MQNDHNGKQSDNKEMPVKRCKTTTRRWLKKLFNDAGKDHKEMKNDHKEMQNDCKKRKYHREVTI